MLTSNTMSIWDVLVRWFYSSGYSIIQWSFRMVVQTDRRRGKTKDGKKRKKGCSNGKKTVGRIHYFTQAHWGHQNHVMYSICFLTANSRSRDTIKVHTIHSCLTDWLTDWLRTPSLYWRRQVPSLFIPSPCSLLLLLTYPSYPSGLSSSCYYFTFFPFLSTFPSLSLWLQYVLISIELWSNLISP